MYIFTWSCLICAFPETSYVASYPSYHLNCWESIGSVLCLAIINSNIFNEHIQFVFLKSKAFLFSYRLTYNTCKHSIYIYMKYFRADSFAFGDRSGFLFVSIVCIASRTNCFLFIEFNWEERKICAMKSANKFIIYLRSQTRPHKLEFCPFICLSIVGSCME